MNGILFMKHATLKKQYHFLTKYIFWFLLAAQIVFLSIVTLLAGDRIIDGDTGRLYQHMSAIWEASTLFVPGWIYPTTMELDCALILALPFYGLTKDAVVAFGCASIVMLALWSFLLCAVAKRINHRFSAHIVLPVVCLLVLIPYSSANLYYWNMMFLNGSQYAFKVMLPLLLLYLLLEPSPQTPSRKSWFLLLVYLTGLFLTTLSSGVYVAAMGVAPLLVVSFLLWLYGKICLTPYTGVCAFGSVLVTLLGLWTAHQMGISISGGQMLLNSFSTLADNAANCLIGFFRLFGAVTRSQISILRLAGMAQFFCWCLAVAMLFCAYKVFHRTIIQKQFANNLLPELYLVAPALWNFFFLTILDTHYGDPYFEVRYHLMGSIPLLLLLVLQVGNYYAQVSTRVKKGLQIGCLLFLCGLVVLCDRRAYLVYWNTDGTVGINQKEQKLCNLIDTLDIQDVFIVQSNTTAEICGALDSSREYKLLWQQEDEYILQTFDGPTHNTDATLDSSPAALVLPSDISLDEMPAYLQNASYIGSTEDYTVYLSKNGALPDGAVGLPTDGTGLDYPNSTGYTYQGSIDQNRSLDTEGNFGVVLQSPSLSLCTTADISLAYSSPTQGMKVLGHVTIRQGDTVVQTQDLLAADSALSFCGLPAGDNYQIEVELLSGARITLESITFTPQQ